LRCIQAERLGNGLVQLVWNLEVGH
jgi:hypothetical protein